MSKELSDIELETQPQKNKTSITTMLTQFASIAATAGVIFSLLGYGVTLAVEDVFSLPHASLYQSPFELLDLSSIAIVRFMEGGIDFLKTGKASIIKSYVSSWKIQLVGLLIWAIIFSILWSLQRKQPAFFEKKRLDKKQIHKADSIRRSISANAFVIGGLALQPIFGFLGVVVFIAGAGIISIAPLMGLAAGKAYIQEWVLDPEQCKPKLRLHGAEKKSSEEKIRVVSCVSVTKDDKVLGVGRVVFSTSKAMVLFNPNTAAAKRVPIDDTVIEAIGSIPDVSTVDAQPNLSQADKKQG